MLAKINILLVSDSFVVRITLLAIFRRITKMCILTGDLECIHCVKMSHTLRNQVDTAIVSYNAPHSEQILKLPSKLYVSSLTHAFAHIESSVRLTLPHQQSIACAFISNL